MWHKTLLVYLFSLPLISWAQPFYSISCDSQNPTEDFVINAVYSGNTPFLRSYHYDSGVPIDLTSWSVSFLYSYGRDDTNGMVEIPGVVSATNCVTYIGGTNIFFQAFDRYYFSIRAISTEGYVKTMAVGRMIQRYDPATATNIPTMMGALNMDWWTNNVGILVESNRVRIAVFETSKVDAVTFNATNVIFEAFRPRITAAEGYTNYAYTAWTWGDWGTNGLATTNQLDVVSGMVVQAQTDITNNLANQELTNVIFQALHTAQGNTNSGFESRIATVETGKMSLATQNSSNATLQTQITLNLTNQNATNVNLQTQINEVSVGTWSLALLTDGSRPANYLNIANTNYLGANIVTNGTFTGSANNWGLSTFYYQVNRVILNPNLTGSIEYTNTLVVVTNKLYQLTVKTVYAGAAVTASVGGVSYAWTSTDGEARKEYFYAVNGNKPVISASTGTNSLELDDVTLKECPTGSVFVAQDVNAGNSVRARVGVYAPNITAISNDLDTAESDIAGLKTSTGTLNTAVGNLQDATNALNANKLNLTGGIMTGPVTNETGYYGNGIGLTNVTASSTGLAWSAISDTPTTYGAGGYGITNLPKMTDDHTALTNQNGSTDFLHLTAAEKAIATNTVGIMERYFSNTNAGQVVEVYATGTGITASRTNEYFYVSIPSGVRITSMRMRVDGNYTAGGVIYLSMGTNDVNNSSVATMWIPSINCVREDSVANVVLTCRPDSVNATLLKIAGLGTTAGIIYAIHLVF